MKATFSFQTRKVYLRELQAAALVELSWQVSGVTLSRACRALRRTRKRDADCGRTGSSETRRGAAAMGGCAARDYPNRVVFLDETWAKTNMTRPLRP
jgi:hypothetical protein